jgi:hypothetical protein
MTAALLLSPSPMPSRKPAPSATTLMQKFFHYTFTFSTLSVHSGSPLPSSVRASTGCTGAPAGEGRQCPAE